MGPLVFFFMIAYSYVDAGKKERKEWKGKKKDVGEKKENC